MKKACEHVEILRRIGLHAVCDINPVRLDEVKALYPDMEVYDNADDLFAKADIDGVIISANNNQHKELAIKAAKAASISSVKSRRLCP